MQQEPYNHSFRIGALIKQYINGELDKNGDQELQAWIGASKANRQLFEELTDEAGRERGIQERRDADWKAAYQQVQRSIKKGRKKRLAIVLVSTAAMAAILAGAVWFFQTEKLIRRVNPDIVQHDVLPGGNKAVLTLANGKEIVLDSNANGILARQGNTRVINLSAGQLAYKSGKGNIGVNEQVQYNILTTPRGGQYRITLPDGSKVWLNAASSLKYPTVFSGPQRVVELTGEAYFEVAENKNMPFKVELSGMEIKVLGTHFNVMAYGDETAVKTSLLEGKVMITKTGESKILEPGEQAAINVKTGNIEVAKADVYDAIAWKNGFFAFDGTDIKAIMRQLARWYDVTVEYKGQIPEVSFSGKIQRNLKLSVVLKYLKKDGIQFSIEGRKIILTP